MHLQITRSIIVNQQERLKSARKTAGFRTGAAAAEFLGVAAATYNAHENGHRGLTIRTAEAYAKAFDVRPAWLMTGEPPMFHHEVATLKEWEKTLETDREGVEWGTFRPGTVYFGGGSLPEIDTSAPDRPDTAYEVVGEWTFPKDFLTFTLQGTDGQVFLINAPDDTMAPEIVMGDRAITDASQKTLRGEGIFVIEDQDGQLHIRRITKLVVNVRPEGNIGVSTTKPGETYFTTLSELKIIGKVIGKVGRIA
jgi:phage repressor protein C with HTH and peptisase S24 domain